MALSFQQDYLTDHDLLNYFHDHNFNYNNNYLSLDSDPIFNFEDSFFSPQQNLISLSPHIFPPEPNKRHKTSYSDFEYIQNPEIPAQAPKFEVSSAEVVSDNAVKKQSKGSLSAQSIAARERRRKITDKTQELGKLIPGGTKMNTAEMLSSAFNYVKFLQAQIQILQLMKETSYEVKNLVVSPNVQEVLYSKKKCLVPTEFLLGIANDKVIQSNPFLTDEIHLLLGTNC